MHQFNTPKGDIMSTFPVQTAKIYVLSIDASLWQNNIGNVDGT